MFSFLVICLWFLSLAISTSIPLLDSQCPLFSWLSVDRTIHDPPFCLLTQASIERVLRLVWRAFCRSLPYPTLPCCVSFARVSFAVVWYSFKLQRCPYGPLLRFVLSSSKSRTPPISKALLCASDLPLMISSSALIYQLPRRILALRVNPFVGLSFSDSGQGFAAVPAPVRLFLLLLLLLSS